MLYDPKWEQPQPTLANFIAWLETKDPNETYSFFDPNNCAVGQWVKETFGKAKPAYRGCISYLINGTPVDFSKWGDAVSWYQPQTFGAALVKARLLQERGTC